MLEIHRCRVVRLQGDGAVCGEKAIELRHVGQLRGGQVLDIQVVVVVDRRIRLARGKRLRERLEVERRPVGAGEIGEVAGKSYPGNEVNIRPATPDELRSEHFMQADVRGMLRPDAADPIETNVEVMHSHIRNLSEAEAGIGSFHDCHVHGLHWRRDAFTFSMDIQYILEWMAPSDDSTGYRFRVCEARIAFKDVDELKVAMDWSGAALDSQIDAVRTLKSRTTPSGSVQRYYEIEFSEPEAIISLWSTGYEVRLLGAPVVSALTGIPVDGEV